MRPIIHCRLVNGPFGDPVVYADFMFDRRALLFDMGDLRALPARKLLRVNHAFISHTHIDRFADFDRLLRLLLGRDKTISLYGPADFTDRAQHKPQGYTWNVARNYVGNPALDIYEVHGDGLLRRARFASRRAFQREDMSEGRTDDDVLATCGTVLVRAAVLDHGTPCLGFALEEPLHVNVWEARLDAMDLQVGKWLHELKEAVVSEMPSATPVTALRGAGKRKVPIVLPLGELRHEADGGGDVSNADSVSDRDRPHQDAGRHQPQRKRHRRHQGGKHSTVQRRCLSELRFPWNRCPGATIAADRVEHRHLRCSSECQ
jgi:ribonuclease Z